MSSRRWLLLAACSAGFAGPAHAATTCTSSNISLGFGSYLMINAAPLDAQSSMTVSCTRVNAPGDNSSAKVTVAVSVGPSQGSGSIQNRQMFQGGAPDLLNYNVYLDAGRISVWGNTTGVDTASQTITVPNKQTVGATFTFYGRLFAQQNVRPGFYSDSLLVTVDY